MRGTPPESSKFKVQSAKFEVQSQSSKYKVESEIARSKYTRDTTCASPVHVELCTLSFALRTLHFALRTSHFALCTLHFVLCTFHGATYGASSSRCSLLLCRAGRRHGGHAARARTGLRRSPS